jgi:mannose-6-phosphate isomerase-like protein (cupin superfamily)
MQKDEAIQIKQLSENMDERAQDITEIRWLARTNKCTAVHCTLQPGQISLAGMLQTVEEVWYCIQGQGKVWPKQGNQEGKEVEVYPGICFTNPEGTHFQVRNTGSESLCFILVTMPPWPGEQGWVRVTDHWLTQ